MSIESATFVGDLQPANPPSTDPRGQGDDHLRLIKQVLQNSFPGLEKAIYFATVTSKTANFSILATDMNNEFLVATTSGAVTATLPTGLGAGDAGWKCFFRKTTTDANPIFVAPATGTLTSGTISGLSQARRCVGGIKFEALWTGSGWIISRCLTDPIGAMIDFALSSLPSGYEWPNGQTLSSSANYPEYNALNGGLGTLDLRGRIGVTLDNLGGAAAGRLAGGIITGTAVGNTGGTDTVTLTAGQLAAHQHNVFLHDPGHSHTVTAVASNPTSVPGGGGALSAGSPQSLTTSSNTTGITIGSVNGVANDNTTAANSGGQAHSNLQPSIMCSKILVVE